MAKLLIATRFPNAVKTISKTFRENRLNDTQTKYVWFTDTDFMVEAEKKSKTNNYLLHNNRPWTVLQFDPSTIERADAKASAEVTLEELIETVIKSNPFRILDGSIKFIANEESKEALSNVINKNLIAHNKQPVTATINNNTVTEAVLNHERINLRPSLVPEINDEQVSGMDDILNKVSEANNEAKRQIQEETKSILEG